MGAVSGQDGQLVQGGALRAFGQYRMVRKIATGGMAEIFLAKQLGPQGFERDVVIKRLRPELGESADFLNMFLDEARLAARLTHPNVVQIHDLGLLQRYYFICMEYLPGEDLGMLIRTARKQDVELPMTLCARALAQAAHGLHYAHELTDGDGKPLNIVHRDVSPSNIFVTYTGNVKLLDFGIARAESRLTHTGGGQLKGKVTYLAPEQALGNPADRRSDIYMLGLTLYEALTGVNPFTGESPLKILRAVLAGKIADVRELRPEVGDALAEIVHKAIAYDPEHRYQSAGELAVALELYLSNFTTSTANAEHRAYMRMLLGEERIGQRSKIPSLATLQARGVRLAGFTDPDLPVVDESGLLQNDSDVAIVEDGTPVVDAPAGVSPPVPAAVPEAPASPRHLPGRRLVIAGAVVAVLVLGTLFALRGETAPAPAPAGLHSVEVRCDEPGVQVSVDDVDRGTCPLRLELPEGEHEIVTTKDDRSSSRYVTLSGPAQRVLLEMALPQALQVERPQFAPLDLTGESITGEDSEASRPSPVRVVTGRVTVDTVPWTRVYVGKKLLGDTPVVDVELPAGRHTLRLVNPERGIRRSVTVLVRPGKTTARRIEL